MSSYWVQPAGIVIDPLVPDEGLDAFDGLQQVVLTTGLHSRHAQRFADAVDHGGEELRFFSDELLGDDPEAVKDGLRAGLRRLLERDFRHVLFAHGDAAWSGSPLGELPVAGAGSPRRGAEPPRMARLLRSCAWCGAMHVSGRWHSMRAALQLLGIAHQDELGPVTHDICETCAARF